jgi:hypothetical protein
MHEGHCLCGQLRFAAEGAPAWVAYCHCASCRRHTGSPVACFVNFPLASVRFSGERAIYESSPGVTRSHCARCGTPIGYQTERRAAEIDLYVNAFARPEDFRPQLHVFEAERLPWFDTRDLLPRSADAAAPEPPASRLAGFIIDCQTDDLWGAARFWGDALRLPTRELPAEEGEKYVRLENPDLHIEVQRVDHPSRVHIDIGAVDVEAEAQRLEALGARRIAAVHTWIVMEAPTGQRFCIVRLNSP